jgi:calcium/calmodulin-dependent protein kinase I
MGNAKSTAAPPVSIAKKKPVTNYSFVKENKKYRMDATVLGSGTYGVVKPCWSIETGEKFAAKIITKNRLSASERVNTEREIAILASLNHPHIIRFVDIYADFSTITIITELVRGGELFDRIIKREHYTEEDARVVLRQLIDAIAFLHERNIAHRDIKPENILVNDLPNGKEVIKLADFGFARDSSALTTICGSRTYMAPEIFIRTSKSVQYGTSCDIWSFGVVMFVLLCGYPPFW